jgi:hypothetical protein
MDHPMLQKDTTAWISFVWVSFVSAVTLMSLGIWYIPAEWWVRGYLGMGLFSTVSATFTLAKTIRDNHERQKLVNRVVDAKTEQILHNYELRSS